MSKKTKLIPPDPKQCQANKMEGCWPDAKHFMVIGPKKLVRCTAAPVVIIEEVEPSEKDGQRGSMSVCEACLAEAKSAFPTGHFKLVALPKAKGRK